MANYAVDLEDTNTVDTSIGSIANPGSGPKRIKLYDWEIGPKATPADGNAEWHLQRCTAAGTSTARTGRPLDPADQAANTVAGEAHTVEPTYTSNEILKSIGLNMRATYRWIAASPDRALLIPATASNGLGLINRTLSGSAWIAVATFSWEE